MKFRHLHAVLMRQHAHRMLLLRSPRITLNFWFPEACKSQERAAHPRWEDDSWLPTPSRPSGFAGSTHAEIANTLVISEKTVSSHVSNLLRKTHTTSRVELARLAQRVAQVQPKD